MTPEEEKVLLGQHVQYSRDRYWLVAAVVLLLGKTLYDEGWGIPGAVRDRIEAELPSALKEKVQADLIQVFRDDARRLAGEALKDASDIRALLEKLRREGDVVRYGEPIEVQFWDDARGEDRRLKLTDPGANSQTAPGLETMLKISRWAKP